MSFPDTQYIQYIQYIRKPYRGYYLMISDTGLGVGQSRCEIQDAEGNQVVEFFSTGHREDVLEEMQMLVDDWTQNPENTSLFLDIEEYLNRE